MWARFQPPLPSPKKVAEPLKWISPSELCRKSVMAGSCFVLYCAAIGIDLAAIIVRGCAYTKLSAWQADPDISALVSPAIFQGLQVNLLTTILYYTLQIILVGDLMLSMVLANRDFQEGTARTFATVAFVQIPIAGVYLTYELGDLNKNYFYFICQHGESPENCPGFYASAQVALLTTTIIALFTHAVAALFSLRYSSVDLQRAALLPRIHYPKSKYLKSMRGKNKRPRGGFPQDAHFSPQDTHMDRPPFPRNQFDYPLAMFETQNLKQQSFRPESSDSGSDLGPSQRGPTRNSQHNRPNQLDNTINLNSEGFQPHTEDLFSDSDHRHRDAASMYAKDPDHSDNSSRPIWKVPSNGALGRSIVSRSGSTASISRPRPSDSRESFSGDSDRSRS